MSRYGSRLWYSAEKDGKRKPMRKKERVLDMTKLGGGEIGKTIEVEVGQGILIVAEEDIMGRITTTDQDTTLEATTTGGDKAMIITDTKEAEMIGPAIMIEVIAGVTKLGTIFLFDTACHNFYVEKSNSTLFSSSSVSISELYFIPTHERPRPSPLSSLLQEPPPLVLLDNPSNYNSHQSWHPHQPLSFAIPYYFQW